MNDFHLLRTTFIILFVSMNLIILAQNEKFVMTTIGSNNFLDKAWDLQYGPDGQLWVTERVKGIVVRINTETAERDELIQIAEVYSSASQDGLLGMALHDGLISDNPYVYLSYTYLDQGQRKQKIVRYSYALNGADGSLSAPLTIIDNLPSSNDHNSGRLVYGPDGRLYYSLGDQGSNHSMNFCNPILAQTLPTQEEIDQADWRNYPGKILRLNVDGSIPADNPMLAGVQSHVYSYGHRNPQGLVFSNSGQLYSDEHGPVTDDEVNAIYAGGNYGWPNVAGFQDNQAYVYCNWSAAADCESLTYSATTCDPVVPFLEESSFTASDFVEPLFSMFAVPDDYDFNNPDCSDAFICRPNVAPSSIDIYESGAIPSWKKSLLVTSLKRGRVYRLKLNDNGTAIVGDTIQHFYTTNRYRDIALDPDGQSFYIITDATGSTSDASGLNRTTALENPGAILKFTLKGPSAVADQEPKNPICIWPNPASDKLTIEIKQKNIELFKGALLNASGHLIQHITDLHTGINEVSLSNLPSGFYLFKLYSNDSSWQQRVVVY